MAGEFGIQPQNGSTDEACRALGAFQEFIEDARRLALNYDSKLRDRVEKVFGKQVAERVSDDVDATLKIVEQSVQVHIDKGRLAYAVGRAAELAKKLDTRTGTVVEGSAPS